MFKVGDEVVSALHGNGVVTKLVIGQLYPIVARFGGHHVCYTVSGEYSPDSHYDRLVKKDSVDNQINELKQKVAKLEADLYTKKFVLNSLYDYFEEYYIPKQDDFFGVRYVHENDHSYRDAVFVCVASDNEKVVAKMLGRVAGVLGKDYKYTFDRKTWHFHRVSNGVVAAL